LDLEHTLVSETWDRKMGWRHALRPGTREFLKELAQYYEIVLYSPSIDGIADPVVNKIDEGSGVILHRLYRDATYYHNGVHVKDLKRLNRPLHRMIVLDDDPTEVQFNPENLIRVKPYTDPTDRTDNTLARITPFLIELVREGYSDFPQVLAQYEGMDADEIADEMDRRVVELRFSREKVASRGLGRLARGAGDLPPPELLPASDSSLKTTQLTAKDIAGDAPPSANANVGIGGWMNRRAKDKEEHRNRKIEKWNEVMAKKDQDRKHQEAGAV
jgi:import inner membrane translocase subunit TIM50